MTYAPYCRTHHCRCTPVYWRPEGKSFIRIQGIVYCPGDNNNPHFSREVRNNYHVLENIVDINESGKIPL